MKVQFQCQVKCYIQGKNISKVENLSLLINMSFSRASESDSQAATPVHLVW